MYYQTKFGSKRISSSKDKWKLSHFDHMSSCIMMHHNTKFGNKMPGGLEDIIWTNTYILTLRCNLDPEDSPHLHPHPTPNFYRTLWLMMLHHHTNLVTKCSLIQKISSGQTITDILNLCCDLDLKCSNSIFPQDAPAYDAVLSNQVWLQTDRHFRRYNRNSHILEAPTVTLTWNTVNQYVCMTLMLYNHTQVC